MPPGPETQRRKFVGTSCPGFVDDRRENADPAAFWPSTGRGRVRTVASTCQDRHFGDGGGLAARTLQPSSENGREPPQELVHLGAGGGDDRRQLLLVVATEGGGVGRAGPQGRGALGEKGGLQHLAFQGLLAERRGFLDDGRRLAGRAAQAAPRGDLE